MKANTTYKHKDGYEFFMCPFTQVYISQGEEQGTHLGTYAVDINHFNGNSQRVPYYAPATVKCIRTIPSYGEATWQTVNKVHCPNGYFGIVTFETVHDESFDAYPGLVVKQGQQLGNMGMRPTNICTGVHCHFEGCQSNNANMNYNQYGVYTYDALECRIQNLCYMDDTKLYTNRNWKYTKDANKQDVKPSPNPEVVWYDGECYIGCTVKSISCAIKPFPGTLSAIVNDKVYVPALGGLVPLSDVTEASDTKDGKCDNYLANTNARVYLSECKVEDIDYKKNLVKVHGYWVNPTPLRIKK